mgnify:CR=1 FL=1
MSKQIIKIDLNGKRIGTKPLFQEDTLTSIREKIKEKTSASYIFLDQDENEISTGDENDYTLKDIVVDKLIKLKSKKDGENAIKVNLDDINLCSINENKNSALYDIRIKLTDKIKEDFLFLDSDGNQILKEDEKDYTIGDCLIEEVLKLKKNYFENSFTDSLPSLSFIEPSNVKNSKKESLNLTDYEPIIKREDLTIYKYSDIEKKSGHDQVYQYFYDKFDINDYSDAYVVLFCGKTGDGKTTAINAFFNIIKGIQLNDKYRFLLINETKKKKGQAESQTDGVHLYYLKDYNNKPIIIIDSQGYGDTRGKTYDEMINETFRYVFSNVIDHINTVCFISKSNTNRLDILTKYIFSSVTSLFSEDISENFIILATFASDDTLSEGPDFIESIKTDADFLNINKRMDKNWWYAFDSKCVLNNKVTDLAKFSFKSLYDLYENKVTKLRPKCIKKCAEILETRNEYRVQVNQLTGIFQNLVVEEGNLRNKEKKINEVSRKIQDMELKIKDIMNNMKKLSPKEQENKLMELNNNLMKKINDLNNQFIIQQYKTLVYNGSNLCTVCSNCAKNCHENCDCNFNSLGRCIKFSFWTKECEICRCPKKSHRQDYYKYIFKNMKIKKDTNTEQLKEQKKVEVEKKIVQEIIVEKEKEKSELGKQKKELNNYKNILEREKQKNENEKKEIEEKISNINKKIFFIITRLHSCYQKINDIAMNNNHLKTEDEYIDSLKDNMIEIGIDDKEQIEKLKQIKENNRIFRESIKLNEKDLINLDESALKDKLGLIFQK